MDEGRVNRQVRLVGFSTAAAVDLATIQTWTANHWGLEQAQIFIDFLLEAADASAIRFEAGKPIKLHPDLRVFFVRWPQARYGHNIILEQTPAGPRVVRILHGAMDIDSKL